MGEKDEMTSKGYKCFNYRCGGRIGDSYFCGESGDTPLFCVDRIINIKTGYGECILKNGSKLDMKQSEEI